MASEGAVIAVDRDELRTLVQRDSELSEILMRAYILRRVALMAQDTNDMVLLGSRFLAGVAEKVHMGCSVIRTARAQKAADSESEDRNAAACLVIDSGYWNREPCPASGYVSKTAFARFSLKRWELETGI